MAGLGSLVFVEAREAQEAQEEAAGAASALAGLDLGGRRQDCRMQRLLGELRRLRVCLV